VRHRRGRLAADLLDLAAVALLVPLLGGAAGAAAVRGLTVTAATWAAAGAPTGDEPASGPLAPPWSLGGSRAEALVDVVATGTLALTAVELRLEADGPDGAGAVTVTACRGGPWDGANCPGATVALGDLTATTTVAVALAPGERLGLRLEADRNVTNRTSFALRVEVPRTAATPGGRTSG
jgi:hypothetical protein